MKINTEKILKETDELMIEMDENPDNPAIFFIEKTISINRLLFNLDEEFKARQADELEEFEKKQRKDIDNRNKSKADNDSRDNNAEMVVVNK